MVYRDIVEGNCTSLASNSVIPGTRYVTDFIQRRGGSLSELSMTRDIGMP